MERKEHMAEYFIGHKEYFPGIGKIPYEGSKSDNQIGRASCRERV